ncbi:MAG TPA: hypothetical protein VMT29_00575 [Steroidobacteraceae bacterium]|nr:hypothetical protein [Steroidobacteraceae bacterium]
MMHTFLFEPGVWMSQGTFWREDGEALEVQGRTEIAHAPECWLLAGTLRVLGSPPVEFVNARSITPPGRDGTSMKWTQENATLGKLSGTYSVVGSSILGVYTCAASGYHGAEHLGQMGPSRYSAAGILLLHERRLYSWQMVLTRAD